MTSKREKRGYSKRSNTAARRNCPQHTDPGNTCPSFYCILPPSKKESKKQLQGKEKRKKMHRTLT